MSLDWPAGFDRTTPLQRQQKSRFQASLATTTSDLETELSRLDPDDWRVSIGNQHTKSNGLPRHNANPDDPGFVLRWSKDGEQFAVACDAFAELRDNVRTVYLWVQETRMRGQRPVVTGDSEFAAARLPPGDEERAMVVGEQLAHEVLGVARDADEDVIRAAARQLKKKYHPDGAEPDQDQFQAVVRSEEDLLEQA